MLTLHTAAVLVSGAAPPLPGGAVAVSGGSVVDTGPGAELADRHPTARVRSWPGLLVPGLVHLRPRAVLEEVYHPDPREEPAVGPRPDPTPAQWQESVRRGIHLMLRCGVTALAGDVGGPGTSHAVAHAGLVRLPSRPSTGPVEPGPPSPDPDPLRTAAAAATGEPAADRRLAESLLHGPLVPGARADLAVFDVPLDGDPLLALLAHGPGACVATVLAGRLVHRRR